MAKRPQSPQIDLFAAQPLAPEPVAPEVRARPARVSPRAGQATLAGQQFLTAVEVAVPSHTDALHYGIPLPLVDTVQPGQRLTVPLQGKLVVGLAMRLQPVAELTFDVRKLRPIVSVHRHEPPLPLDLLETLRFCATYYHAPLGAAARLALPAPLRHTGVDGDDAPERLQPMVSSNDVRPWPDGLGKAEVRILQKIEAAGTLSLAELRRPGESGKLTASTKVLEALQERGLVRLWQDRVLRDPMGLRTPVPRDTPPELTPEQRLALHRIQEDTHVRRFAGHLLRGITGSGKTEVYLHVIADILAQGRGAIVLVPEIALTPLLVRRFRARFGDQVAALHSAMSEGERLDQLAQVASGARRIVVGPRSALFAPVAELGVIVVDECHDSSFKQQNGLRYHARDVALARAKAANAACVLGSATPGCEEMLLAHEGKLHLTELHLRATGGALPLARVIDLRESPRLREEGADRPSLLSEELVAAVAETVARGEQAILLHNRRGFATSMLCQTCGATLDCPECAVTLTWHKNQGRLRCHLCDHSVSADTSCPTCHGHNLLGIGAGTEKIEDTLAQALPQVRMARFDRDTAAGQRLHDTLGKFARQELDVLVGTQMLAKGHDFPAVTLVGVVLAESGLQIPDFRASERTFQLLTQVAGRAGRGQKPGRVLVQTYMPDHPAIQAALRHDHAGFVQTELMARQRFGYPPYTHLALLETRHLDESRAQAAMVLLVERARALGLEVRGPLYAGVARVRGIWRWHALLRSRDRRPLHACLRVLEREVVANLPPGVTFSVDVDPCAFG